MCLLKLAIIAVCNTTAAQSEAVKAVMEIFWATQCRTRCNELPWPFGIIGIVRWKLTVPRCSQPQVGWEAERCHGPWCCKWASGIASLLSSSSHELLSPSYDLIFQDVRLCSARSIFSLCFKTKSHLYVLWGKYIYALLVARARAKFW